MLEGASNLANHDNCEVQHDFSASRLVRRGFSVNSARKEAREPIGLRNFRVNKTLETCSSPQFQVREVN